MKVKDKNMENSIRLNITRPNGETEEIEVLKKFHFMNQELFNTIKKSTADAKKGIVNFAEITERKSNMKKLVKRYNDLHNEGGEGYIPDDENYFKKMNDYKEWEEIYKIS